MKKVGQLFIACGIGFYVFATLGLFQMADVKDAILVGTSHISGTLFCLVGGLLYAKYRDD